MNSLTLATLFRDAGAVQRYHTKRTLRQQSIAEHTFNMLMLIKAVAPGHVFDTKLISAVLHHDLPELMTGDIPAPMKRMHPALGPLMDEIEEGLAPLHDPVVLSLEQEQLLKWADRMELVLWCLEERRMGNTLVDGMVTVALGWIRCSKYPQFCTSFTCDVIEEAAKFGLAPAKGAELETGQ